VADTLNKKTRREILAASRTKILPAVTPAKTIHHRDYRKQKYFT
jgi:hypothetical protein